MFTQLSIQAIPGPLNDWSPSLITVYRAADEHGFIPSPQSLPISAVDESLQTAVQTGVGYLISDAASNNCVVDAVTILPAAYHVEGIWDRTDPDHPVFSETVRRKQYSVSVTRHQGDNSGTITFSTESLPSTVRDAWLSVLASF